MQTTGLRLAQILQMNTVCITDHIERCNIHWIKRCHNGKSLLLLFTAALSDVNIRKQPADHCNDNKHYQYKNILVFLHTRFSSLSFSVS